MAITYRQRLRRRSVIWMKVKDPELLKRRRKRLNLSQTELAFLAKCSQATISLLEVGGMKTLSEDLALELAKRLASDWEDLFVATPDVRVQRVSNGSATAATRNAVPA